MDAANDVARAVPSDRCDPIKEIAIAVVEYEGAYLVGKRPDDVPLAGYSEFPGGKIEDGETPARAAVRECREEAGVDTVAAETISVVDHAYSHGRLRLHFIRCIPVAAAKPIEPYRWVAAAELAMLSFPPANAEIVRALVTRPS